MNPAIAKNILFPLGGIEKTKGRQLAHEYGLPNHNRADSQGLCFVGNVAMRDFLAEFIKPKLGDILDDHTVSFISNFELLSKGEFSSVTTLTILFLASIW